MNETSNGYMDNTRTCMYTYKALYLVNVVEHFLERLGDNARIHWCACHGVRLTTGGLPIGKDGPCKQHEKGGRIMASKLCVLCTVVV